MTSSVDRFSAVAIAHAHWKELVKPGDLVIDATCGNGKDTLVLAKLVGEEGIVIGLDIQEEALAKTRAHLEKELPPAQLERVRLFLQSHATLPLLPAKPKLIVYNLGYLPGGNKKITTYLETTLASLKESLLLLPNGGAISLACYPGHPEGAREAEALLRAVTELPCAYSIHRSGRESAPFLILIRKI